MTVHLASVLGVRVLGSGAALPRDVDPSLVPLDNARAWHELLGTDWRAELARRGWSEDHPERAWGVRTRHAWPRGVTSPRSHVEDLARAAAEGALEEAGCAPGDLDALVVATSTPAHVSSSLASRVGRALGLGCAALDVRAGGASGLAAWTQAALMVAHGLERVLVVAVESVPDFLEADDVTNRLLFSSAAGALVLGAAPGEDCGLLGSVAGRVDGGGRAFTVPGELPPSEGGRYTFQPADGAYLDSLRATWDLALAELGGLSKDGFDHFLPYAVTRAQLERAAAATGASVDRALVGLASEGCTGCASPLRQVHELRRTEDAKERDTLGLVAVGGGISWQVMLWRC